MMKLKAGEFEWQFPRPVLVMGVLNVTPDSFSDGGQHYGVEAAVARAIQLAEEGADIIDVGGESTRPRAEPVSMEEELRRVLPVVGRLVERLPQMPISVDTRKAEVARAVLREGASFINDVGANREDPEMWERVGEAGAGYVAMHMQGDPMTMQDRPHYEDVVCEVHEFFRERLERFRRAGLAEEQVVVDPGIGFGKTLQHNLQLLCDLNRFKTLKRPRLLGVSRKSFMGKLLGAEVTDRLAPGLACAAWATLHETNIVRTHDVRATRQAVRMVEAIMQQKSE